KDDSLLGVARDDVALLRFAVADEGSTTLAKHAGGAIAGRHGARVVGADETAGHYVSISLQVDPRAARVANDQALDVGVAASHGQPCRLESGKAAVQDDGRVGIAVEKVGARLRSRLRVAQDIDVSGDGRQRLDGIDRI